MREKLNTFISNLNGQFVEVSDRTNIYQCLDLVYLWVFALDIPKATIRRLYAYEVYDKADDLTRQYFELIGNTPDAIPQPGDLVVWNNKYGPAGHIAIATGEGNTTSFMCFEQNNPLGTNAHVQLRKYTNVVGFLRPKNQQKADPKIVELEGQIGEWARLFDNIKEHLRPVGVMPGDEAPKVIGAIDGLVVNRPVEGEEVINIPKGYHKLFNIGKFEVGYLEEVMIDEKD